MQKAVFLDRDGVIIEDTGHPGECSQLKFLSEAGQAIKSLNDNGFKVIIVSNQAGVAKGYFSEAKVREVNEFIRQKLAREGALIDGIYYCPHHTEGVIEEYRKDCYCRKPNPGMIEQAVSDFDIDLTRSFLIGDKMSDIEAGHRAGCRGILLAADSPPASDSMLMPEHVARGLGEAVAWLLNAEAAAGKSS